jgi:hypothetical protein
VETGKISRKHDTHRLNGQGSSLDLNNVREQLYNWEEWRLRTEEIVWIQATLKTDIQLRHSGMVEALVRTSV